MTPPLVYSDEVRDPRSLFVERVASGRSFIDIGGLWGLIGEQVSTAHRAGATDLALLDVAPADSLGWRQFEDRMARLGIDGVECISTDFMTADLEPFDVVHSAGVLYHLPHPLHYLRRLRELARHHLVLTTSVFPPGGIEHPGGTFDLPPGGALFVPALDDATRVILENHWRGLVPPTVAPQTTSGALGIQEPYDYTLDDYEPFWWLLTTTAVDALCEVCGFEILDHRYSKTYNGYTLLLGTGS